MATNQTATAKKPSTKSVASARGAIRRTEIDGVTCFWTPVPGPFSAALLFRVGRRDETLPTAGITHLVEHLALSHLDPHDLAFNGRVEMGTTIFHASGTKAEVAQFLCSVTGALTSFPLDRFEAETRVLTSEASMRSTGIVEWMCGFRFGPRGPGLIGYPEYGLRALDASATHAWARSRFTAANAVLVLTGQPPRGLRLHLDAGRRAKRPAVDEVSQPLPAFAVGDCGVVAMSFVAPNEGAGVLLAAIVQKRLHDRLRRQMGVTYQAFATGEPLDEEDRLVALGRSKRD